MKILLTEDDPSIAKVVSWGLRNERFEVDIAPTAASAIKMACSGHYDLMILDLMLPDKHGSEVIKQLRNAQVSTPVIVLTALSDLQSKVKLFNLGADDYMVKPFEFEELFARIKSALRKQKVELADKLHYAGIDIDLKKREVHRDGKPVGLREKEIKILEYLVRHAEQVLTREMILNYVWGPSTERVTNVVDVHIHYLRDQLDKPFGSKLVKTVSTVGYKISSK